MAKNLKDILNGVKSSSPLKDKIPAEKIKNMNIGDEIDVRDDTDVYADRAGNTDDLYKAANIKTVDYPKAPKNKTKKEGKAEARPTEQWIYSTNEETIEENIGPYKDPNEHYPMTYMKIHSGETGPRVEMVHTHMKFPKGEKITTPERVRYLVKNDPKHKKLKEQGYSIHKYGEHDSSVTHYTMPVHHSSLNEEKDIEAGKFIKGFEDSTDKRFKGKSKAERKKQALAAYYASKEK